MKTAISKNLRNIRFILTTIFIALFVFGLGYSLIVMGQDYVDITTLPKPHTFEVPININLNGAVGFVDTQVSIGLYFTYPNGTLFVGDKVDIIGYAYLKRSVSDNISMIAIGFQNCLEYPIFEIFNGIPKQGMLQFGNERFYLEVNKITGEVESVWYTSANVTWSIEGDYKPIIGIFYTDGKNSTMTTEDVVIHVYPKGQLTQIQTNKVTTQLAFVAYVFSGLGVASIIIQIYPRKEKANVEDLCRLIEQFLKAQESTLSKKQQTQETG